MRSALQTTNLTAGSVASSSGRLARVQLAASRRPQRRALQVYNMFTGIVQGTATIAEVNSKQNFSQVQISFPAGRTEGIKTGASVAINGTCLTVTEILPNDTLCFDIMMETLRATNLGDLKQGSTVNFERSARVGDEIGGHNVSGHVHCRAAIHNIEDTENNRRITFKLEDPSWVKYIMPKGYIGVDGCSLTIGEVWDDCFTVYLIPETIRVTVFGVKSTGDKVNIEIETQTQAIVDTTERVVASYMQRMQGQGQQAVASA